MEKRKNIQYTTTPNWRIIINCIPNLNLDKKRNALSYVSKLVEERNTKIKLILQENKNYKLILHGASSQLGDIFANENIFKNVEAIVCDGNEKRSGENFFGYKLQIPKENLAIDKVYIICFSSYAEAIEDNWRKLGFKGKFYLV